MTLSVKPEISISQKIDNPKQVESLNEQKKANNLGLKPSDNQANDYSDNVTIRKAGGTTATAEISGKAVNSEQMSSQQADRLLQNTLKGILGNSGNAVTSQANNNNNTVLGLLDD